MTISGKKKQQQQTASCLSSTISCPSHTVACPTFQLCHQHLINLPSGAECISVSIQRKNMTLVYTFKGCGGGIEEEGGEKGNTL